VASMAVPGSGKGVGVQGRRLLWVAPPPLPTSDVGTLPSARAGANTARLPVNRRLRMSQDTAQDPPSILRLGSAPAKSACVGAARTRGAGRAGGGAKGSGATRSPNNVEDLFAHVTAMVRGVASPREPAASPQGLYFGGTAVKLHPAEELRTPPPARLHSHRQRPSTTSPKGLLRSSSVGVLNRSGGSATLRTWAEDRRARAIERSKRREAEEVGRSRHYAVNLVKKMQETALCAKFIAEGAK